MLTGASPGRSYAKLLRLRIAAVERQLPSHHPARALSTLDSHHIPSSTSHGALRHEATRKYGSIAGSALNDRPFACSWLTSQPDKLNPDDIVASLPSLSSSSAQANTTILLITPGLASWISPGHPFLEQWHNKLFPPRASEEHGTSIYSVAAVIDSLPVPPNGHVDNTHIGGSEGIATMVIGENDVVGRVTPNRGVRGIEPPESVLAFSIRTSKSESFDRSHEIGLRLANTIFMTGKKTTMFGMQWRYADTLRKFVLNRAVDLAECSVSSKGKEAACFWALPLHPVGQRRKVVSSMGNILRQIAKSVDGTSAEAMPASAELEKDLPRYIAEHKVKDQRVSVWALVQDSGTLSPSTEGGHLDLAEAIGSGGRLHRVMSGGGGWGKKQGLLSLDPESTFSPAASQSGVPLRDCLNGTTASDLQDVGVVTEQGSDIDHLTTLSQVAKPGDFIQFFVSIEPTGDHRDGLEPSTTGDAGTTFQFGVVSDGTTDGGLAADQSCPLSTVLPNYFGALSQTAITYSGPCTQTVPEIQARVLDTRVQTKLDVPGSRVQLKLLP